MSKSNDPETGETLTPSFASRESANDAIGDAYARTIEAAVEGNVAGLRKAAADFLALHGGDKKQPLGRRVSSALRRRAVPVDQMRSLERLPVDGRSRSALIEEQPWPTTPLILSDDQDQLLKRFLLENRKSSALADANLAMRSNLLLSGPPGTGKSFLAGHVAARLGLPFFVVRLDAVISSLLGDTAKNIRAIFEFANNASHFLFIDEMDAVAQKRDDQREMGEIKRVVNTLIQGLDGVHSHTVIVGATNHAHLLDPAIYRRFPYALKMELPCSDMRQEIWKTYLPFSDDSEAIALAMISEGLSGSDIHDLAVSARRASIVLEAPFDIAALAWSVIQSANSSLVLPPIDGLSTEERRKLNANLSELGNLTFKEIGTLTGVSKQAAMRMAKSQNKKAVGD